MKIKKTKTPEESEESVAEIDPETLEDTLPLLIEKCQIQRNQPALLLHMCCTDHVPGRPMAIDLGNGKVLGAPLALLATQPRCPTASKKVQICKCSNSEMSWAMCCGMVSMKGAGSCDC